MTTLHFAQDFFSFGDKRYPSYPNALNELHRIIDFKDIDLTKAYHQTHDFIQNNQPQNLAYFYFGCFELYFENKQKLKNTPWSQTYQHIKDAHSEECISLFFKKIENSGVKFIKFCQKKDNELCFFSNLQRTQEYVNKIVHKTLYSPRRVELRRYIAILDYMKENLDNCPEPQKDIVQEKINEKKLPQLHLWHLLENPYIQDLGYTYEIKILSKIKEYPLIQYAMLCEMQHGCSLFLKYGEHFGFKDIGGHHHDNFMDFVASFKNSSMDPQLIHDYIAERQKRAKIHKPLWANALLQLNLEKKENTKPHKL